MSKGLAKAMLFAGQGAQFVGMGQDLFDSSDDARHVFSKANEVLGYNITNLCFNGPKEVLDQTINTQPAVFTYNMAVYFALGQPIPDYFAGHSLGEVCAVVGSGCVSLEVGFKVIQARARFMQQGAEKNDGSMIAPIGLSAEEISKAIRVIEGAYIANYNSADQTTVSGTQTALNMARQALVEAGAKRVVNLAVNGAFHSPFMQEAADNFAQFLSELEFNDPSAPIVTNVDAIAKNNAEEIKLALSQQISAPVQFVKMLDYFNSRQVISFTEIGPGRILSGLVKRNYPEANVCTTENIESINKAQEVLSVGA